MDFANIEKLMELMRKHGMQEISVADEHQEISIKAPAPAGFQVPMMNMPAMGSLAAMGGMSPAMAPAHQGTHAGHGAGTQAEPGQAAAGRAATASGKIIKSPFVGTFYRSSQPGAQAFASVGQRVKKGDVLCIVEAMKLMNEIESEVDGVIREVLVENEHPVEFDQPLFIIE
jgi:acetyl-CoA carboxylase biotin carboxyl carrier protein